MSAGRRYRVELKPAAAKALAKVPRKDRERIARRIDALADNPRPHQVEQLGGQSEVVYRIRAGNYRVLYQVADDVLLVLVVRIADRKDAYRELDDLV